MSILQPIWDDSIEALAAIQLNSTNANPSKSTTKKLNTRTTHLRRILEERFKVQAALAELLFDDLEQVDELLDLYSGAAITVLSALLQERIERATLVDTRFWGTKKRQPTTASVANKHNLSGRISLTEETIRKGTRVQLPDTEHVTLLHSGIALPREAVARMPQGSDSENPHFMISNHIAPSDPNDLETVLAMLQARDNRTLHIADTPFFASDTTEKQLRAYVEHSATQQGWTITTWQFLPEHRSFYTTLKKNA